MTVRQKHVQFQFLEDILAVDAIIKVLHYIKLSNKIFTEVLSDTGTAILFPRPTPSAPPPTPKTKRRS